MIREENHKICIVCKIRLCKIVDITSLGFSEYSSRCEDCDKLHYKELRKKHKNLTQEMVLSAFFYSDGKIYKINFDKSISTISSGRRQNSGYLVTALNYSNRLVHRLIFLYHKGYLPKYVYHIDGDRLNNRIENLREATMQQNNWNLPSHKNSSSKYKGVNWYKAYGKWRAQIKVNGKGITLGYFDNELEAHEAYTKKAKEVHGEFFNETL